MQIIDSIIIVRSIFLIYHLAGIYMQRGHSETTVRQRGQLQFGYLVLCYAK